MRASARSSAATVAATRHRGQVHGRRAARALQQRRALQAAQRFGDVGLHRAGGHKTIRSAGRRCWPAPVGNPGPIDENGHATVYQYDPLDRLAAITDP